MKTLILCIDRDNDLGRKTEISSPVIGRNANIQAAEKLALADPEESDVNCMFSAIRTFDKLENEGEIVTICGSAQVGPKSDIIIARQLDQVIRDIKPDGVVVITDGDEDEYILPLIQSRVKIDAIKRVVVRQSETLEGTYYLISKFMEDEKMQRKFMLPVALVLFLWGLSALLGSPAWGFATILLVLGAYLFMKVFHLQGFLASLGKEMYSGLESGRISLFTNLLAVFILISAIIASYNMVTTMDPEPEGIVEYTTLFIYDIIWWFVLAVLIVAAGRFVDMYFKEKRILWTYIILPFSMIAFGLISSASLKMIIKILFQNEPLQSLLTMPFLTRVIVGVLIAFIGTVIYHIANGLYGAESLEKH